MAITSAGRRAELKHKQRKDSNRLAERKFHENIGLVPLFTLQHKAMMVEARKLANTIICKYS